MSVLTVDEGSRERLVDRLFDAFSLQVSEIEARIAQKAGDGILEDARVLGALAKTLETLVGVKRKLADEAHGTDAPVDFEALRTDLMTRLLALKQTGAPAKDAATGASPQKEEG